MPVSRLSASYMLYAWHAILPEFFLHWQEYCRIQPSSCPSIFGLMGSAIIMYYVLDQFSANAKRFPTLKRRGLLCYKVSISCSLPFFVCVGEGREGRGGEGRGGEGREGRGGEGGRGGEIITAHFSMICWKPMLLEKWWNRMDFWYM